MNEVVKFLQENPLVYVATIGLDGKPKNRPFMFMLEHEGKLWFCTNNTKSVYAQLQKCPFLEISVSSPAYAWIRLKGTAVFENNMTVKEAIVSGNPLIQKLYGTADNPVFEAFYLSEAAAEIADFSGNQPKIYQL